MANRKYEGEGHDIELKNFDARYSDLVGLNILHKLVRFKELDLGAGLKYKVTIEVKEKYDGK